MPRTGRIESHGLGNDDDHCIDKGGFKDGVDHDSPFVDPIIDPIWMQAITLKVMSVVMGAEYTKILMQRRV
jgi:hypothetical protein